MKCEECAKFFNQELKMDPNLLECQDKLQNISQRSFDESNMLLWIASSRYFEVEF